MAHKKVEIFLVLGILLTTGAYLSLAGTLEAVNNATISFQITGKNLPSFDPFGGYPDPYVVVTYENPPNPPLKLGETSKLADTQNPSWPETFNVVYLNGSSQRLTLDLYDDDIDADDYMGAVEVRLDEILSTFGGVLERSLVLNNSTVDGKLAIHANITNTSTKNIEF